MCIYTLFSLFSCASCHCKMASASAKSQALARVGRRVHVSQRGLEAVLKEVEENPEILGSSRGSIKRSRDAEVDVDTPYGTLLGKLTVQVQKKKGIQDLQLPVLNLQAFLWHVCSTMPCMTAFMQQRLALHPSQPDRKWRMCLYCDEISPGNPLRALNTRKVHAFYVSFAEYGAEARCQERFWYCICLARTTVVNTVVGGLSALTHKLLESADFNGLANGCLLTMGPSSQSPKCLFFAEMHTMLGDEAALKMVFDVKGASGTLPCPLCTNLVSRLHEHDPTGRLLLPLHTTDYTLLRCVSDESAWQTQALLISREPTMTKKDFAQLQQSVGMNWNPHGVLAHRSLGLRSSLMFDFMHIYLVNGLFHQEVGRLLPKLYEAGHSFESILSFMESFSWPHNLQSRRNETLQCFQKKTAPDEFRASASQSLNSYPLLRLFVLGLGVMDMALSLAVKSFLKLCKVLDLLLDGNRGNPLDADTLQDAVVEHLKAVLASHGELGVIPKFHYALHLGLIAREKALISCFTHERKHKEIKRKADELHNPQHWFEDAVMKDVWGRALLDLQDTATMQPHLMSPKLL